MVSAHKAVQEKGSTTHSGNQRVLSTYTNSYCLQETETLTCSCCRSLASSSSAKGSRRVLAVVSLSADEEPSLLVSPWALAPIFAVKFKQGRIREGSFECTKSSAAARKSCQQTVMGPIADTTDTVLPSSTQTGRTVWKDEKRDWGKNRKRATGMPQNEENARQQATHYTFSYFEAQ